MPQSIALALDGPIDTHAKAVSQSLKAAILCNLPKKVTHQAPQQTVKHFWDVFTTKHPGKINGILPENVYARSKAAHEPRGVVHGQAALKSYDETKEDCIAAVDKIAKECRRVNMRYRDPHFDIEFDLKWKRRDCLEGLVRGDGDAFEPKSVKRVPDIFEKPKFYVDDATATDVRQGNHGDCYFLAALCALSNKKGLIDRVCVHRDEPVGVYGFVFHRDGEWFYTIIDDKLYLNSTDYDESKDEKFAWDQVFNRQDPEEEYLKAFQKGSRALYFAQCSDNDETWLPLLEKAYAKAHGDYRAIYGGFTGEAIEDLTGGVTTELFTSDILDIDKFWKEELLKVNEEFLFGCATGFLDDWNNEGQFGDRKGIVAMHAYSIMEAKEIEGKDAKGEVKTFRLLKIRNPWGKTEWQGAWSDGSCEWTAEWMTILKHKFGNDGIFWISYEDLLRKYQCFDRTRLFGDEWSVTQQWTTLDVPWTADYNDTKFTITLENKGPIVIVLSQLDDNYFRGLQGQYEFSLHFRLDKYGENDYIVRSHGNYLTKRSVSTDLELEPGTYSVLMKITAKRYAGLPKPEKVLRANCKTRQEKLVQIGLSYDLAHARGQVKETEEEKKIEKEREEKAKASARKKRLDELKEEKRKRRVIKQRQADRAKRRKLRAEEHKRKKAVLLRAAGQEYTAINPTPGLITGADITPKDVTTQARIDAFTQAKIDAFARDVDNIPSIQDQTTRAGSLAGRVSSMQTAGHDSDGESVCSVESSIDSILDLDLLEERRSAYQEAPYTDTLPDAEDENDEFANDPWNAVCIVGLRVFSKDKGVTVSVVRPKVGEHEEETPLDLDDPSKGICEDGMVNVDAMEVVEAH